MQNIYPPYIIIPILKTGVKGAGKYSAAIYIHNPTFLQFFHILDKPLNE